ncbi:hypothetical protein [Nocardia jejuensis]|uniref:hypothetical protein n=1 Tax=Nocardia jejuensis TaxID=328049 RepID=UPI00082D8BED|nr:hypothetical protein [Nocardia jejuensis]
MVIDPLWDGLESVPWAELHHAYGSAEDVPEQLLQLQSSTDDEAATALHELFGSIWHQGTVYSATAYAVPFLARLAGAGIQTCGVLDLLAAIAASTDERGVAEPGAARHAVAQQWPLLRPFMDDADEQTRRTALHIMIRTQRSELLLPLLLERWEFETEPWVRTDILTAAQKLDDLLARDLAIAALGPAEAPQTRLRAATTCIAAGTPWEGEVYAAGTAWLADDLGHHIIGQLDDHITDLVDALVHHCDIATAADLITLALTNSGPSAELIRRCGMSEAERLSAEFRSAAKIFVPVLATVATKGVVEEYVRRSAVNLLCAFGPESAPGLADKLATLAGLPESPELADAAVACLVQWRDPRATFLLAQELPTRPEALSQMAEACASFELSAPLLDAIRNRLSQLAEPSSSSSSDGPFSGISRHNELIGLFRILRTWAAHAHIASPEVINLLNSGSLSRIQAVAALTALAAMGIEPQWTVDMLTQFATQKTGFSTLDAATALHELTGHTEPLLTAIENGIQKSPIARMAAEASLSLAPSERLVTALTNKVAPPPSPDAPAHELIERVQIARLWVHHGGEPAAVLPVLTRVLHRPPRTDLWTVIDAANLAARIGPAAEELLPALASLLDSPRLRPAAVRALLNIAPAQYNTEIARAELIDMIVADLPKTDSLYQQQPIELFEELGPSALTPDVVNTLRQLAVQDRRMVRARSAPESIQNDESFRRSILAIIADQTPPKS